MVIHPPSICLIETETKSNKSYEVVGYKEVVKQERRDNGRDESKGHPNNEDSSGRKNATIPSTRPVEIIISTGYNTIRS